MNSLKEGISLRNIHKWQIVVAVILSCLMLFSTYRLVNSFMRVKNASEENLMLHDSVHKLMDASDYLTEMVQRFTESGDRRFMEQYFIEAFATKRREQALSELKRAENDAPALESLQEAMRQVVANSMHQYDFMQEPVSSDEIDERDDMVTLKYATSTRITPVYNKNGIVTFERVDVIKKNDKVTSITHRYYSFDVKTQSFIDLNRLFRDDALADVCQLLKQQLLKQNNATGNEQLNDLGYFNVENIMVTSNFYFDDKGVTWSYLPNEMAVEAVGEPRITIPYNELKDYLCDESIINKLA